MSQPTTESELHCPHCGADVMPDWTECWLCSQPLSPGAATLGSQRTTPNAVVSSAQSSAGHLLGRVVLTVTGLLLLLMVTGIAVDEGIESAIGFLFFLAPAFVITATKALKRRGTENAMSAWQISKTFILWAIGTWLLLIGIVIAAVAALFVVCMAGGGIGNMH